MNLLNYDQWKKYAEQMSMLYPGLNVSFDYDPHANSSTIVLKWQGHPYYYSVPEWILMTTNPLVYIAKMTRDIIQFTFGGGNVEHLVDFAKYCKRCKHRDTAETEEPCNGCLAEPANEDSRKPVRFEKREKGDKNHDKS